MSSKADVAWLVELKSCEVENRKPVWLKLVKDSEDTWTRYSSDALRFCRKEDATNVIEHYGWTEAFPTEYIWPAQAEPAPLNNIEKYKISDEINWSVTFALVLRGFLQNLQNNPNEIDQIELVEMFIRAGIDRSYHDGTMEAQSLVSRIQDGIRDKPDGIKSVDAILTILCQSIEALAKKNLADAAGRFTNDT